MCVCVCVFACMCTCMCMNAYEAFVRVREREREREKEKEREREEGREGWKDGEREREISKINRRHKRRKTITKTKTTLKTSAEMIYCNTLFLKTPIVNRARHTSKHFFHNKSDRAPAINTVIYDNLKYLILSLCMEMRSDRFCTYQLFLVTENSRYLQSTAGPGQSDTGCSDTSAQAVHFSNQTCRIQYQQI